MSFTAPYERIRYAALGRGPVAFDCWGLALDARARHGFDVPVDPMAAALNPRDMRAIVGAAYSADQWEILPDLRHGALVFFPTLVKAVHCGIALGDGIYAGVLDISRAKGLSWRTRETMARVKYEVAEWVG